MFMYIFWPLTSLHRVLNPSPAPKVPTRFTSFYDFSGQIVCKPP